MAFTGCLTQHAPSSPVTGSDYKPMIPLTTPLLLDLHALLWDMIASSGIAETERMKNARATGDTPQRGRRSRGSRGISSSGSARGGGRNMGIAQPEPDSGPADPRPDASGASRPSAANEEIEPQHKFSSAENAYLGLKLQQLLAAQEQDNYYGDDDLSDEYDSDGENGCEEDPKLVAEYHIFRAKMAAKGFYPAECAWAGAGSGAMECGGN